MERRAPSPGRTGESPVPTRARRAKLFCRRRFFVDNDLQVRGHVLVQLDGDGELADRLEPLVCLLGQRPVLGVQQVGVGALASPIVLSGSCSWILRRSMLKLFFSSASAISPAVTDPNN